MAKFLLSLFFIFIPELGFASNKNHSCKKTVLSLSNQTPMKSKSKTDGLLSNHTPTELNSHLQLTQTNLQETPSPISSQLLVNSKPQTISLQKNSSSPSKSPQSKSKFIPFLEAQKMIQPMNISGSREYLKLRKKGLLPDGFPSNPNRAYKDEGWTTWKNFLGSSYVSNKNKNFMKFEDAIKTVREKQIKSRSQYQESLLTGLLENLPWNPNEVYAGKGWVNWKHFLGTELHSFEDAQKLAQSMKIESRDHYRLLRKKGLLPNMPATPERTYRDKGWTTWGDFTGSGNVSNNNKELFSFEDAQKLAQSMKIETKNHYRKLKKDNLLPDDMPWNPNKTYAGKGWTTWGDFTGSGNVSHNNKEFFSFEEAQKLVQSMNILNRQQYHQAIKDGLNMPSDPDKTYAGKGWVNWWHFFGKVEKEFLSFEEAQKIAQSMNILSSKQYNSFKKNGLFPDNMHSTPSKFYKDKGWKGWKDFLGTTKMMKYNQAKKYAIHEAKVNTVEEFIEWLNSDQVPLKFPQNPAEFYEEWTNAKDFLDLNNETEIITHLEFKKFVQKLNLKTKRDYTQWWIAFGKSLDFMPRHPETFYEKEWEGWDNYLIPPQKNLTQESQQIH